MRASIRQRLLIGVAVLAAAAALIIAVIGSGGKSPHVATTAAAVRSVPPGDLQAAASYIGVSRSQLRSDLRGGKTLADVAQARGGHSTAGLLDALLAAKRRQLEAGVAAGKLSKQQQGARLKSLRRRAEAEIRRARRASTGSVRYLAVTTAYLGLPAKRLQADRRAGKSLAEVADSTGGRSAAGLIAALLGDRRASLEQDVSSGAIGRGEARRVESSLPERVRRQVERKPHTRG